MSSPNINSVVGLQWGAEEKSLIVDYLAQDCDIVIFHQYSDIKAKTKNGNENLELNIVPTTVFNPDIMNIISSGTLINLDKLHEELESIKRQTGLEIDNLFIDERATLILPYHIELDSTSNGIASCAKDKSIQNALRVSDLMEEDRLIKRLEAILPDKNRELSSKGLKTYDLTSLLNKCNEYKAWFGDYIIDTLPVIRDAVESGAKIVISDQIGTMVDNNWGNYPYSLASNSAIGVPANAIGRILGVAKAYSSFTKHSPQITKMNKEDEDKLRKAENDNSTKSYGWFDATAVDYACYINGVTELCISRLDALDSFDCIKVCIGYNIDGEYYPNLPEERLQERAKPIYADFAGWQDDISKARSWDDLPEKCQSYIIELEKFLKTPITFISVGSEKEQLIVREI